MSRLALTDTLFGKAGLAVVIAGIGWVAPACAGTEVMFPVVLGTPATIDLESVPPDGKVFSVSVRSTKAVRIMADVEASFRSEFLDRGGLTGNKVHLRLVQGTVLVFGIYNWSGMYCAAVAEKEDDFWGWSDGGVCLRDRNKDDVFDEMLAVDQYPWRVRIAYEINKKGTQDWMPVSVPYAELAEAEIPVGEIVVRYDFRKGSMLSLPVAWIDSGICWPASLAHNVPNPQSGKMCGTGVLLDRGSERVSLRSNAKGEAKGPHISIRYTHRADDTLKVEVTTDLKPGPALLSASGREFSGNGRDQSTFFDLFPLDVYNMP